MNIKIIERGRKNVKYYFFNMYSNRVFIIYFYRKYGCIPDFLNSCSDCNLVNRPYLSLQERKVRF